MDSEKDLGGLRELKEVGDGVHGGLIGFVGRH